MEIYSKKLETKRITAIKKDQLLIRLINQKTDEKDYIVK